MTNPVKISALIITFNETLNIERCIKSCLKVADEIVVVDSFSSDDTVEKARLLGAKVIQNPFEGHIQQKNFAITQAKYSYVLSLDADEELSSELTKSILEIKNDWQSDGYSFNRLTKYGSTWIKHGGWYPDVKVRLWKVGRGKWGGDNPHDRFELNNPENCTHIEGDLLHYSIRDLAHHKQIIAKFSSISAQSMYAKGKKGAFYKMLINPFWKFMRFYFIQLGFLDGLAGFYVAWYSAYATFLKYFKLQKLYNS